MLNILNSSVLYQLLANHYKHFKGPHVDYADNNLNKINICNKAESLRFNAVLVVITKATKGSRKKSLYQDCIGLRTSKFKNMIKTKNMFL